MKLSAEDMFRMKDEFEAWKAKHAEGGIDVTMQAPIECSTGGYEMRLMLSPSRWWERPKGSVSDSDFLYFLFQAELK